MNTSSPSYFLTGFVFAALWASASVAAKFGLPYVEPLVLFLVRFAIAGSLMLGYVHFLRRERLPRSTEWRHLTIFAFLNTTAYLGLFVLGIAHTAAGIGTLATAINPLLITLFVAVWAKRPVAGKQWIALTMGMTGVGVATLPLLQTKYVEPIGLVYLALSMIAYSIGTVYYAQVEWQLPRTVVNGWQAVLGGMMLVPFAWVLHRGNALNTFSQPTLWYSLVWLAVPVSVISIQLWLFLLKIDAVKASLWLFLCPIFGFVYATLLLGEPFSLYTVVGTALVLGGLWIGQQSPTKQ
jgi:probable blue pigment (indigoidine) exporter